MTFMHQRPAGRICPPAPDRSEIFLDFDGTITPKDILDELFARYSVDDSWLELERRFQERHIGSHECLAKQFDLVRITPQELAAFLETFELDPGVERLFALLASLQVPTTIVSDGIDSIIQQMLARLDPLAISENLTIRANTIHHHGDRLELVCPHHSPTCESAAAHCKCRTTVLMHTPGRQVVYIGDGLSDLCPARRAHTVFAKSRLAEVLAREDVPFAPFQTLDDVAAVLAASWSQHHAPTPDSCACRKE